MTEGVNWAFRYRPGWEASYVAAWIPLHDARDAAAFFDKSRAVDDLVSGAMLFPEGPVRPLAPNAMAKDYLPQLKTALELTFATPSHAFIVEDDWNSFDIVFSDDTTWWRLSWGTSA